MSADRAYDIVNLRIGGSGMHQPHVRVRCSTCVGPAALLEFPVAGSPPAEHIAKKIRGKGWEFVLENRRYTRCPECIRVRDAARKGESPGPKQIAVELFGKPVPLPEKIVPPELVPPPTPVPDPRVFRKDDAVATIADVREVRTEVHNATAEIARLREELALLTRTLRSVMATRAPTLALVPTPPHPGMVKVMEALDAHVEGQSPRARKKAPEVVAKMRKSQQKKAEEYTQRVRGALLEIRSKKTNGREPSFHEYARLLTKMGVEPFRPGRPWSASIIEKHLSAMDAR